MKKRNRRSKYVGKTFDNNWVCSYIGIAYVQGKNTPSVGAKNYYYIFERRTSDNKADKILRLNSTEASKVYKGELLVEDIAEYRANKVNNTTRRVSYYFGE